jgi:hypothetical protein
MLNSNGRGVRERVFAYSCIGAGAVWLYAVLHIVLGNVILRETPLAKLAQQIDRLPPTLATPIYVVSWCVFLFGWAVPVGLGVLRLLRRRPLSTS